MHSELSRRYVMAKVFEVVSIFQYQATIFYAQYYQMNSPNEKKLTGINGWFIIEILSFYGYILSAVVFIYEYQIKSSLGLLRKDDHEKRKEVYRFDFVAYHRKDLDWMAFVTILTLVNIGLLIIDE